MTQLSLRRLAIAALVLLPCGTSISNEKAARVPVGKWIQVADNGVHELTLIADRLVWTWRPNEKGDPVKIEAAFQVTKDSFLFAFITFIDGKVKGGPEEEDTFAFRFRFDDEHLTIKEIRGRGFDEPLFKKFAGRYARSVDVHPSLKHFNAFEVEVRNKARMEIEKAQVPREFIVDQCLRDLGDAVLQVPALDWLAKQNVPENVKTRVAIAKAADKLTHDKYPAVRAHAARLLLKWGEPVESAQALVGVLERKDAGWIEHHTQAKHLLDRLPAEKLQAKEEQRVMKVLLIEGTPRYEYRFCRAALERDKLVDLKVLLLAADQGVAKQDRVALAGFPASEQDLNAYNVVILGDVDPKDIGKVRLGWLADFVKSKGGGLLFVAGQQFSPHAYKDTPLADILPIALADKGKDDGKDRDSFRMQTTATGRKTLFRFAKDEKENEAIVERLPAMHWFAEAYKPRAKAEVLAVHPTVKIEGTKDPQPLIVAHTVGKGRSLFFGIAETWRWRFREQEPLYNQFWLQTMRYLAKLPPLEKAQANPDDHPSKGMITQETQKALDEGLTYLAQNQAADGSWGTNNFKGSVGITSLAALSFLSAGHHPGRGPYSDVVIKALKYVMAQEDADIRGFLTNRKAAVHGPMYCHGYATQFLAEVHGTIVDPKFQGQVKETLQRAVDIILKSQNFEGGWRYQPIAGDADISVTACQVRALHAARHAGLFVPKEVIDKSLKYIKDCQDRKTGGFSYMRVTTTTSPGFARSAAGMVALHNSGLHEELKKGLEFLMRYLPGKDAARDPDARVHFYYAHYYTAQAMWFAGGDYWRKWFPASRDELIRRPGHRQGGANWQDHAFCTHYCTAMALLILQVPNNYLPMCER